MRYLIQRPDLIVAAILATLIFMVAAAVALIYTASAVAAFSCSGVQVEPGDDLDAIVNRDARSNATTFCVHAASGGTTYNVSDTLYLKDGDRLIGETGTTVTRGPAVYGVPKIRIRPSRSLDKIVATPGKDIQIKWVDIAGAVGRTKNGNPQNGTGAGITGGGADGNLLIKYVVIHGNDAAGILIAKGRILNSEFYDNTQKSAFLGFNGSAMKGITEYEAAFNYVHDEQGNGIWCDVGCENDPARANGFWAHDNLVVNNNRSGIRYESSPQDLATGVHASQPTALIEENEVHGNSTGEPKGAISASDTQNALIRANVFGAKTIAGVAYPPNEGEPGAIRARDSGRSGRTDLWDVDIVANDLNGEQIRGCELPDSVVSCSGNAR